MYIVDFFKRLGRKSNIPIIIYLILNIFLISGILFLFLGGGGVDGMSYGVVLLISLGFYLLSLVIALSPIGEWILRIQTGCKKIKDQEVYHRIFPLFQRVYQQARAKDPSISPNVQLFISDDASPNAFATGRKTVCVTMGMLSMPDDQIMATLGHEFGHLAHKDTDLILVVSVGNLIVFGLIFFLRLVIQVFHIIFTFVSLLVGGRGGFLAAIFSTLNRWLMDLVIAGLTWLWTWIGTLLVMKSSRSNEFEADAFSADLGYAKPLAQLLDAIDGGGAKGLFATLQSSHPRKEDRIARLMEHSRRPSPAQPGPAPSYSAPHPGSSSSPYFSPAPAFVNPSNTQPPHQGGNPYQNPYQGGGQSGNPYQNPYQGGGQGGNPYQNPYQGGGQGGNPYQNPYQGGGQGGNPYQNPYQGGGQGGNPYQNPYQR